MPEWQPYRFAILWGALATLFVWLSRGERGARRVAFMAAWLFLGLSVMAKGAPGLVLPLFVFAAFVVTTRRWRLLLDAQFFSAVVLLACVVLPWFVQMYARHGVAFTDRLIFHDMYKRAFVHVHDTNAGDDTSFGYYIWQLGYGLFPWSGLAGASLLSWVRGQNDPGARERHGVLFIGLWFLSAFAMFTVSMTKFHHYILPAVPPIAALVGLLLDRLVAEPSRMAESRKWVYIAAVGAAAGTAWVGIASVFASRAHRLRVGEWNWVSVGAGTGAALLGAAGAYWLYRSLRIRVVADTAENAKSRYWREAFAMAALVPLALVGRDLIVDHPENGLGQIRMLHLFTYNYERLWPQTLSFRSEILSFVVLSLVATAFLVRQGSRRFGLYLSGAFAFLWSLWLSNVYLVKLAPHWGQRELALAYYAHRSSPTERLVAYQMNWKGENFYAGNRIPAFVSSGEKFKDWIKEERARGQTTMYFVTEHSRADALRSELGNPRTFQKLTDPALNNKFVLIRSQLSDSAENARPGGTQ